jgi:hypothetical protein
VARSPLRSPGRSRRSPTEREVRGSSARALVAIVAAMPTVTALIKIVEIALNSGATTHRTWNQLEGFLVE